LDGSSYGTVLAGVTSPATAGVVQSVTHRSCCGGKYSNTGVVAKYLGEHQAPTKNWGCEISFTGFHTWPWPAILVCFWCRLVGSNIRSRPRIFSFLSSTRPKYFSFLHAWSVGAS